MFLNLLTVWMPLGIGVVSKPSTANKVVTAIQGQFVMLGCSLTESSLEHCTVVWQRRDNNKVVHSYYYKKDQNTNQDLQYAGRTSLFPEELKNGNASLKLREVKLQDSGLYECYVSCKAGQVENLLSVNVAAYYDEPVLWIKQKLSGCLLTFESYGFPKADVSWYSGDNLNHSLPSKYTFQISEDGLYKVQSTMEINVRERTSNYTFVLRNAALNQTILRTLSLSSDFQHLLCFAFQRTRQWIHLLLKGRMGKKDQLHWVVSSVKNELVW
ncbi:CD276 antigen-like isoform X2 [Pristis pectinata]|uniref:CD276 antigen-like isoform X2 n=1 Tax=Pristis pectinata TaxID=685728 RepID=UPI00223E7E00|nr:CD276 antigen-like isoform X2 [Pristis pectinata]